MVKDPAVRVLGEEFQHAPALPLAWLRRTPSGTSISSGGRAGFGQGAVIQGAKHEGPRLFALRDRSGVEVGTGLIGESALRVPPRQQTVQRIREGIREQCCALDVREGSHSIRARLREAPRAPPLFASPARGCGSGLDRGREQLPEQWLPERIPCLLIGRPRRSLSVTQPRTMPAA
jgi:hypothetical protein